MEITNDYGLPESIVNLCSKTMRKPQEHTISCTELIAPVQIRHLKLEHWDSLKVDASSMLWAIFGRASHSALEGHKPEESLSEDTMAYTINDVTVTGTVDLVHDDVITDWKFTSVWSFLLGEKKEWEQQLNVYAWLYTLKNMYQSEKKQPSKLVICAFLRDWTSSKINDKDYPKIPFVLKEIPLWSFSEQDSFVANRLKLHFDDKTIPCTDEERWKRPDTWAVKREGIIKALRVLPSKEEAEKYISEMPNKNKTFIEWRQGGLTRCEKYCIVNSVCPQFQAEAKETTPLSP